VGELFERHAETAAIDACLADAAAGAGRMLLVAGQAGIGKSALIDHGERAAAAAGFTVLRAAATPTSAMLPHRLVRDWLGPLLRHSSPGQRPFDGPAQPLAAALGAGASGAGAGAEPEVPGETWSLARLDYALTWILEGLSTQSPLLLVVDDVHWIDEGSLQLLDLVAARLRSLRAVLLLGLRTGEVGQAPAVLTRLTTRGNTIAPRPLSVIGVEQMRRRHGQVAPDIARLPADALHRRTGGVPYLVDAMLRAESAEQAPRNLVESLRERLDRLGAPAVAVARTTAALGDHATFDLLADMTGTTVAALADPLELLADAGILTLGMWQARPAHPLVAEAILSGLTPSERDELHRAAVDHLDRAGASRTLLASHLVHTLPGEDPAVVALLRESAADALAAGASAVAARLLLRAVGETRPEDTDPTLLGLAATAHLAAGKRTEAFDLWQRALERTADPEARARLLADVGDAQMTAGARTEAAASHARAVEVLATGGYDLASAPMREALVRLGLSRLFYDGSVGPEVVEVVAEAWPQPPSRDSRLDRRLFALAGADLAVRNTEREQAVALAGRALGDGALLEEESAEGMGFYLATAVLYWSDAYQQDLAALDAAIADAQRRGSVLGFAMASYSKGMVLLRQGRLHPAATELEAALDLRQRGWSDFGDAAVEAAATTYLGLGRVEDALALEPELRRAAGRGGFIGAQVLAAAGRVRAAQRDHEQALTDYLGAGDLMRDHADNASIVEWRELAASSLLALGREEEARALAEVAVRHARTWGAPRALGHSLRTLAWCSPEDRRGALFRESSALLEQAGSLDRLAHVRIDLAETLLETTGADEARSLLHQALDYARSHDVIPVASRATRLLRRAGEPVEDVDAHPARRLTPSEQRVAELAAGGDTNRRIAQKLFVTVKAVEWHLSNTYRKLGISSRTELADALYGDPGSRSSSLM
jgi:DNA-binding CsgD family transcriptional regulator